MSKPAGSHMVSVAATAILLLWTWVTANGQQALSRITVEPRKATVEGSFNAVDRRNFAVVMRASSESIEGRTFDVLLRDADGLAVPTRRLIEGEYLAAKSFRSWSYGVNLPVPKVASRSAHSSWVAGRKAVLFPEDLLPLLGVVEKNNVRFDLSKLPGWQVYTANPPQADGVYSIDPKRPGIFVLGDGLSAKRFDVGETGFELVIENSDWHFTIDEAAAMITEIAAAYQRSFGMPKRNRVLVAIAKFPESGRHGAWEAETRGSSVLILSGDMPFRTQSLQRLHEQLRHELFHLWFPDSLDLAGEYDWFYEGFAQYQSLKLAVAVNRIRFEDFVDTLSRAYRIDAAISRRRSLAEASKVRWEGSDMIVYARGLLLAFLCDVRMIDASRGRRSSTDLLQAIIRESGSAAKKEEAGDFIVGVMRISPELAPLVGRYILGTEPFHAEDLEAAGFEIDSQSKSIRLTEKPNRRQKAVLDRLGYNNWRKLSGK